MTDARGLIADLNTVVSSNRSNINDTLENFRAASENLRDLTASVKQQPWMLIRGKPAPDRAVPVVTGSTMIMRAFLVSVVVGLLAGCGSVQGPAIRYYKLDIPPAPTPAGPSVPVPLRIEPFRTTSLLRQDRIVYRPSPVEVGFYEYHRWAEPPNDTVTKALADQLTGRRLFQSVEISDGAERAEYVLRGSIDRLQEVDYKGAVRAQVSISAELEDPVRREKIWSSVASSEFVVKKSDVQAVVAAMGQASQQSIERLVTDVVTFVKLNRLGAVSSAGTPSR